MNKVEAQEVARTLTPAQGRALQFLNREGDWVEFHSRLNRRVGGALEEAGLVRTDRDNTQIKIRPNGRKVCKYLD